ncbi:RNHCP domain-containing protein [Patescibacteria group bacterium]
MVKSTKINEEFVCSNCGHENVLHVSSCRNHCSECLVSQHVDEDVPGDRMSQCQGLMHPIGLDLKDGQEILLQKCDKCSKVQRNKVAPDDSRDILEKIAKDTNPQIK